MENTLSINAIICNDGSLDPNVKALGSVLKYFDIDNMVRILSMILQIAK